MVTIQGTHSGIRSLFQNDETITEAKKHGMKLRLPGFKVLYSGAMIQQKQRHGSLQKTFSPLV